LQRAPRSFLAKWRPLPYYSSSLSGEAVRPQSRWLGYLATKNARLQGDHWCGNYSRNVGFFQSLHHCYLTFQESPLGRRLWQLLLSVRKLLEGVSLFVRTKSNQKSDRGNNFCVILGCVRATHPGKKNSPCTPRAIFSSVKLLGFTISLFGSEKLQQAK
jgi:hypothetical protein